MAVKRKWAVAAAIGLFGVTVVVAFTFVPFYRGGSDVGLKQAAPASMPASQVQNSGTPDFSKLKPRFTSDDFQNDTVIMNQPAGRVGSSAGVYFIESSRGTFWVWNRPWNEINSDFACEVVGRIADGPSGAWSLFLTHPGKPVQGIRVTFHGDGTLEIGANNFADASVVEAHVGPFIHPAIKQDTQFNRLLIILRGQELSVFVNGISVCDPVHIKQRVLPGVLALSGSAGTGEASRAEFTSCNVWRVRK